MSHPLVTFDGMNTTHHNTARHDIPGHIEEELPRAIQLLRQAGLSFTIVEACPHPRCEVCRPLRVSAAA